MRKASAICTLRLLAPPAFGGQYGRAADAGKRKKKGLKKLAFWQKKGKG
jgi:hypothetical protein